MKKNRKIDTCCFYRIKSQEKTSDDFFRVWFTYGNVICVDIVGTGDCRITVLEDDPGLVNCELGGKKIVKSNPKTSFRNDYCVIRTWQDVFVSVFRFIFHSLALFSGMELSEILLLQRLRKDEQFPITLSTVSINQSITFSSACLKSCCCNDYEKMNNSQSHFLQYQSINQSLSPVHDPSRKSQGNIF